MQAFYWLEVESSKFKDIDSFKQYYDLDIEAAADFYADISMHVTNGSIRHWLLGNGTVYNISDIDRAYADTIAWLDKLVTKKSSA